VDLKNLDKSEILKEYDKLYESKEYYKTAFNILADLVWLKDLNGVFLRCNEAVTKMVGLDKSEILGKEEFELKFLAK
jgi:PAS domain S-box-containing protein